MQARFPHDVGRDDWRQQQHLEHQKMTKMKKNNNSLLTESLLLARLGESTKGDIRLLALCYETIGYNTHNIKMFPVVCFRMHGRQ